MSRARPPEWPRDERVTELFRRVETARHHLTEVKQRLGEAAAALDRAEQLLRESLGELSEVLPKRAARERRP